MIRIYQILLVIPLVSGIDTIFASVIKPLLFKLNTHTASTIWVLNLFLRCGT